MLDRTERVSTDIGESICVTGTAGAAWWSLPPFGDTGTGGDGLDDSSDSLDESLRVSVSSESFPLDSTARRATVGLTIATGVFRLLIRLLESILPLSTVSLRSGAGPRRETSFETSEREVRSNF